MKFDYSNKTKLVFGPGRVNELKNYVPEGHKKVLLHFGSDRIKKSGLYDRCKKDLLELGLEVFDLGGVVPNPRACLVRQGVDLCRKEDIDLVLAVGGGSVLDSAKAICAATHYEGDLWELFVASAELPEKILTLMTVLTFPATGSESSTSTVINNQETGEKRSLAGDQLRPAISILDPELTLTLPDRQTFAGVVDMLTHIFERYMVDDSNYGAMDEMSEGLMRTIIKAAYMLKKDPQDMWAREQIMLASTLAHNGILGLGRNEDWASHRIGHELSAIYDTIHGESLAIIFPAWMAYNKDVNPDRFRRFATKVLGLPKETKVEDIIAAYKSFLKDLGMPVCLKDIGIDGEKLEEMAEKCVKYGKVGAFKVLDKDDVLEIYKIALQ